MLFTVALFLFVVANTKSALRSSVLDTTDSNTISVKSAKGEVFTSSSFV